MSTSLDHLQVESIKWSNGMVFTCLSGPVDVPVHGQVEVLVYPRPEQNLEDIKVLREAESRFERLIPSLSNILEASSEKIKQCFGVQFKLRTVAVIGSDKWLAVADGKDFAGLARRAYIQRKRTLSWT